MPSTPPKTPSQSSSNGSQTPRTGRRIRQTGSEQSSPPASQESTPSKRTTRGSNDTPTKGAPTKGIMDSSPAKSTPSKRSVRGTPISVQETPSRRSARGTPMKGTSGDEGSVGTPMRWGTQRNGQGVVVGASDTTSPARVVATSPPEGKCLISLSLVQYWMVKVTCFCN